MSIEQHVPQNAGNDWINSLERAVEICRDQISFARAMKVEKIAVPADSLEKILDALPAATPTTSAAIEAAKEISSTFALKFQEDSLSRVAAIITKHLAARTGPLWRG